MTSAIRFNRSSFFVSGETKLSPMEGLSSSVVEGIECDEYLSAATLAHTPPSLEDLFTGCFPT